VDKLIVSAPLVATQLSELNRDADMVRVKVTQLVSKKAEAEITADLEAKNGPSSYRVLESAHPPATPANPNRSQALLLALLGALALGAAVSIGQELSDRSLRSAMEAGDALALPVLACVPELNMAGGGTVALLPMHQVEA